MSRNTSGLWRGGPGRPPGLPNKATRELRAFLQAVMNEAIHDPQFQQNLVRAIVHLELDPKVLQLLWSYAYGRAPLSLDVTHRGATLEEIVAGVLPHEHQDEDEGPESPTPH